MTYQIKRIKCNDGHSLSIAVGRAEYCDPRQECREWESWLDYQEVEVGYVQDSNNAIVDVPQWNDYRNGEGSKIYGYVPKEMVLEFIQLHGGKVNDS